MSRPKIYTHTQFLGWSINTGAGNDDPDSILRPCVDQIVEDAKDAYGNPIRRCYMGNRADLEADILKRVDIMKQAIEAAYSHVQNFERLIAQQNASDGFPKPEKTLKVFVAPEFYFRGPYGAYDVNSMLRDEPADNPSSAFTGNELNALGRAIEEMVRDPKYSDWLFVAGSVIAAARHFKADGSEAYDNFNMAPIYKGGPDGDAWVVTKHYVSRVDYINAPVDTDLPHVPYPPRTGGSTPTEYSEVPERLRNFLDERGYTVVQENIFVVDNIVVGIEICLDHRGSVLAKNLHKAGMDAVQVQIITSAGMNIMHASVPAGGTVVLQDGILGAHSQQAQSLGKPVLVDLSGLNPDGGSGMQTTVVGSIPPYTCQMSHGSDWIDQLNGYYAFNNLMGCTTPYLLQKPYPRCLDQPVCNQPVTRLYNFAMRGVMADVRLTGPSINAFLPVPVQALSTQTRRQAHAVQQRGAPRVRL